MKFKAFSEHFLQKRRVLVLSKEISASTFHSDVIRLEKMIPAFAAQRMDAIASFHVDKFLDFLILNGKSPATRNRYRALLHTIFKYAMRMGLCVSNPVSEIPILSERVKVRRVDYWKTEKEIDLYIEHAYRYREVLGVGAAILCLGGCRISELLALKWGDIEWERGYVRIRRIVERHTNTVQERTKGQKSGGEYQMLIFPRLREILLDWKNKTAFGRDEDFIVRDLKGAHLSYDVYHKHHDKIIARAGLKRITPHDLRRTFASAAERAGFHKAEIGELLGHETLQATEAYTLVDVGHLHDKGKRVRFGV